ncbi:Complex I intermediate-associated protein 30 (CIA30) [Kordia sp. SMS9]|uniref:CIA30 family protein n=1 Tax=Kordia sp. SMS9 TaxID=2282170 RepID=UPI000E1084B6|nr:CIA30 family protein [Kordia sp. SMS9]AXG71702.1 Complex I intermediate-associated protein 30 (CIA30) [Kordia sp. SMS9]
MNQFLVLLTLLITSQMMILFKFSTKSDLSNWYVVNDGVMGGLSQSTFLLNEAGNGEFTGRISLENNGGFCSVRYGMEKTGITGKTTVVIHLKGDGKTYQFRLKENRNDRHSYIAEFKTSGEWETIEIPLNSLYPSFRGRKLDIGNFSANQLEELGFLIGNKKEESFHLELETIALK